MQPRYEIDHIFICTAIGAAEAERLIAFGLTEGSRNRHPGQGTANRRFFFRNAMLELLWVDSEEDARSDRVRRLGLWERWSERAALACPFGVCYRPIDDPTLPPPFDSWEYQPPYAPITIFVALTSTNFDEALRFYIPQARKSARDEPQAHAVGVSDLTSAAIVGRKMELTFDGGEHDLQTDFSPHLPLVINR
jgi:hypothetical protein